MYKFLLQLLQFVSVVITGILAITNLIVDYKDKKGKITNRGKKALIGTIIVGIISIITFGLDLYDKKQVEISANQQTLASVKRSENILNNINRSLNPIKDVYATFFIDVSFDDFAELKNYKNRLKNGLKAILPYISEQDSDTLIDNVYAEGWDAFGNLEDVEIWNKSSLFPNAQKEPFANIIFEQMGSLYFYKNPISVEEFKYFAPHSLQQLASLKEPDLKMSFERDYHNDEQVRLRYNVKTDKISIEGFNIKSNPRFWHSNGKIISLPDLAGTQVFISFGHASFSSDPRDENKRILGDLSYLSLKMTDGRRISIGQRDFKEYKYNDSTVSNYKINFYEYRFPKNIDSLFSIEH